MSAPKLYLNEHLSPRLAQQLCQYGFDVVSTVEAGMRTASDDEQFTYAVSQQRAVVTFNHKDFAVIHSQYIAADREHWEIILSTEETLDVLRSRLLKLLNALTDEELKNQIRWLNEFR